MEVAKNVISGSHRVCPLERERKRWTISEIIISLKKLFFDWIVFKNYTLWSLYISMEMSKVFEDFFPIIPNNTLEWLCSFYWHWYSKTFWLNSPLLSCCDSNVTQR